MESLAVKKLKKWQEFLAHKNPVDFLDEAIQINHQIGMYIVNRFFKQYTYIKSQKNINQLDSAIDFVMNAHEIEFI